MCSKEKENGINVDPFAKRMRVYMYVQARTHVPFSLNIFIKIL